VAAAVSLSPAAVSLALRGKVGVSEATRTRVFDAAKTLGYRPIAGVSRQHQKQMTIGLVIKAVYGDAPEANRFYAPVLAGIEESCRAHRMNLMLATMPVDEHYYPMEVPRIVTDRTCDGLIVVGAHLSRATAELLRHAPPSVLVDVFGRRRVCLRFDRDGQHRRGPDRNRASSFEGTPQHRHPGNRAADVSQHPAAAPGLQAGPVRGRPGSPLHRRPVLAT
jgi:LacI family transcriptional regulator